MNTSPELIGIVVFGLAVVGFLWRLSRDMRVLERDMRNMSDRFSKDLRNLGERTARDSKELGERVARLEGLLEGLRDAVTGRQPEPGD